MTLLVAWVVFPLVLAVLALGCGLLVERAAGVTVPRPLLVPVGFAVVSLTTLFAVLSGTTASLATPAVVSLAVAGIGLSWPWRLRSVDRWCVAAALSVFAVFAAPVVLSGRATFAGYIKLDDTATYLAMLDRAMSHGYNVAGLPPSTYEATLSTSLALGYPLGSLLPLGVGATLVGEDPAWLWQPYVTFLAMLIGLGLYELASVLVRSRPLRAAVAFVGAQAALIYGFALWGGIKELTTAALLVLAACLLPRAMDPEQPLGTVVPLALACAAIVGALSVGGAVWLAPLFVSGVALAVAPAAGRWRTALRRTSACVGWTAVFAIPAVVEARTWLGHAGAFTSGDNYGNLVRPLSRLQVFGIWPHGDFRTPPASLAPTHVLVAVVAAAVAAAVVVAWRRRAWVLLVAVGSAAFGCVVYVAAGSPWIGGKALATASPIVLAAGLIAVAVVFEGGRRVEAGVAAAAIVAGVLYSNALQYHDVFLAPRARLAELESIGDRFGGRGPTLLTQFDSYGARHFLRDMTPEAASELRRHFVYLRDGGVAATGVTPDIDEIRLDQVLSYRLLVTPRSGVASRPPSSFDRAWRGRYYEVWRRSATPGSIVEHVSLGGRSQAAGVAPCSEVLRVARLARRSGGVLAAVRRSRAVVIQGDGTVGETESYGRYGENPGSIHPYRAATIAARFSTPARGSYDVWVGGSFKSGVEAWIDGKSVGEARNELNWPGNYVRLGNVVLARGSHAFRLRYAGPDLRPGSAGIPGFGLGPFVIASGTAEVPVDYVDPANARSLCGRSLDWIEAVRRG